jgi:hypothetical protein
MTLGLAEYRSGHFAEADAALIAAAQSGKDNFYVAAPSAFYRAMSQFRQGKEDEARKLAIEAASKMKPLPKDEKNPLAGNAYHNDLIVWMAYKEAIGLIPFEPAAAVELLKERERTPWPALAAKKFTSLDLQPKANQQLTENFHHSDGNSLKELPQGEQVFEGVPPLPTRTL